MYLHHYKSPTALLDMHYLACGISSLLHSVNLIVFTLLLVHLILGIGHLITVITSVLTICHPLDLSLYKAEYRPTQLSSPLYYRIVSYRRLVAVCTWLRDKSALVDLKHTTYRLGQIKWHHFTFLLVTHECIHKILWFFGTYKLHNAKNEMMLFSFSFQTNWEFIKCLDEKSLKEKII